jgi:hypothetical protein
VTLTCGVVVVELRGFEPLTPCMPSRNPSTAPTTHPCVAGPCAIAVVLARGGSRGLVRLDLLPRCCRPTTLGMKSPADGLGAVTSAV